MWHLTYGRLSKSSWGAAFPVSDGHVNLEVKGIENYLVAKEKAKQKWQDIVVKQDEVNKKNKSEHPDSSIILISGAKLVFEENLTEVS